MSSPYALNEVLRNLPKLPPGATAEWGAIESGGHQVVGFVALRQNKPAQSGRLGGGQGCATHPPAPLCAARLLAAQSGAGGWRAHP